MWLSRQGPFPPIDFWTAAAHAHPTDLTELGHAAWNRGLYRDAAQLFKRATLYSSSRAAANLLRHLRILHPNDHHPAHPATAFPASSPSSPPAAPGTNAPGGPLPRAASPPTGPPTLRGGRATCWPTISTSTVATTAPRSRC